MAEDTAESSAGSALSNKPEAGKLSLDDKMRFGPVRLSYCSARDLANTIATSIAGSVRGNRVVIAGTTLIADFANLQTTIHTLEELRKEYISIANYVNDMRGPKPGIATGEVDLLTEAAETKAVATATTAAATGNPIVGAALGALALLQQDVEFHGVETKIDRLAFELAVASGLMRVEENKPEKVFIPDLMLQPLGEAKDSPLRAGLQAIGAARIAAWKAVAPLISRVLEAEVELEKAKAAKNEEKTKQCQAKLEEERRKLEPVNSLLIRADKLFDSLQDEWRKVPEGEQISALARMFRIEAINAMKPVYLHCAVVDSGGHHQLSRSLWNFLLADDGLGFAGGAVVRWALLGEDGAVNQGGLISTERKTGHWWRKYWPWNREPAE